MCTFYCSPHLCMSFFMTNEKRNTLISLNKNERFLSHSVDVISQWRWILNSCGVRDSHSRFSVTLIKVGISFYKTSGTDCIIRDTRWRRENVRR